ncbi:MAG TPA: AarF/UbiB family protein [Anaerolineaceae bacterium]
MNLTNNTAKKRHHQQRFRRILWFFARILLSFAFWDILLPKVGLRFLSRRSQITRLRKAAASFRVLAIQMGGVMIKVGQFLSARLDVLPREITDELAGLQDEVRPETFDDIRTVVEAEYGEQLQNRFETFDPVPTAAASIGQVHRATIRMALDEEHPEGDLRQVVVKIQRPDIENIVETDLSALRIVARWIQRYEPVRKHADVPALTEEFSRSLYEEIDYLHEGRNAETFKANFKDHPEICVPEVIWSHTTRRVLTLEYIEGIKITDYAAIEAAGIDRAEVANRLFDTYLKQIFEDTFFHADPHPGNLFVLPGSEAVDGKRPWTLVFIDFGMTGQLSADLRDGLQELLIAIGTQDAGRMIRGYKRLNFILPGADLELLERAAARLFERFWGKTAPEIMKSHGAEADQFIQEFGELIYEMPFQMPENYILLVRCMGILSGMCTGLYADFNLWTRLAPYTQKLVEEQVGSGWRVWTREIGTALRVLLSLPRRTETLYNRIEQGKIEIRTPDLTIQVSRVGRGLRRLTAAIIFTAFLLGGVMLYTSGAPLPAVVFWSGAFLAMLATLFSR